MTFLRYIIIQLLAYSIDVGLFLVILKFAPPNLLFANVLAKLSAGIFAFVAHRNFTFHIRESSAARQQAVRYFLLLALNIPLASAILALLVLWVSKPLAAKFMADIFCVALTYGVSKYFIFIGKHECLEKKNCIEVDA